MRRCGKERLYFEIGPENDVTFEVDAGEEFEVETQMNAGAWLDEVPDGPELRARLKGRNPSSGCIRVKGAEPGDMLTVHIGEIRLDEVGFSQYRGSNGALPSWFGLSNIGEQYKRVTIRDNLIVWGPGLEIPVRPMLGFVGVSPARERYHNGWAGAWGGNLDIQELTTGAKIYLPVFVPGARLQVGDMHAVQGDGEICGLGGVESAGIVRLRCELSRRPGSLRGPRLENDTHLVAVGLGKPAEDAFRLALEDLILWLEEDFGLDRGEAYLLLGQVLEARCTQFVNPTFTYVAGIAKKYLLS
jgi:amidase